MVSCTKTIDTATNASLSLESSNDATVVNVFSNCKLRYIIHEHHETGERITGLFTYNAAGNPYSMTYTSATNTGNPRNHYFLYDKSNRLREYRNGYAPNDPVEAVWHRYGYNSSCKEEKMTSKIGSMILTG